MILDRFFYNKNSVRRNIPQKNGKWKEFNKHAVLITEGVYVDGRKHGEWREYYDSGELLILETYHNGLLHGRYASFHRNGRLMSEGNYRNGLREGEFRVYDESGRHIESIWFHGDVQIDPPLFCSLQGSTFT